jgi:hypothetical protein
MYWLVTELGNAYAYKKKSYSKKAGIIALGTDFPVACQPNVPHAQWPDSKGYPRGGFQIENALTREET